MLGLVEFAGNPPGGAMTRRPGSRPTSRMHSQTHSHPLQFRIVGADVEHMVESVEEFRRRHGRL